MVELLASVVDSQVVAGETQPASPASDGLRRHAPPEDVVVPSSHPSCVDAGRKPSLSSFEALTDGGGGVLRDLSPWRRI